MFFSQKSHRPRPLCAPRSLRLPHARPALEVLESRIVPYGLTGNAWPNPQLITLSFEPDGTVVATGPNGNITSNLFSYFNGLFSNNTVGWENVIIKAAQTWAAQTNINFSVIADSGAAAGSGNYQQGDPTMGDVRVGGFDLQNGWLGSTYYPPPVNNYSVAGDVAFNTTQPFAIGTTYDLSTVAMHEMGHALGLDESTYTNAVMYGYYTSVFLNLGQDDINGIQAIYGIGRPADVYNSNGSSNGTFATAANISSTISSSTLTAVVSNLDLQKAKQLEYYTFTTPSNSANTMTVTVQSTGLSLLTPKLSVYNSSKTLIASKTFSLGSNVEDGATLSLNVSAAPNTTYYVEVQGADTSVFSTGDYALTLNVGTGSNPTVPLPNTQVLNGNPLQSGGGSPEMINTSGRDDGSGGSVPVAQARAGVVSVVADANLVNGLLGRGAAAAVVTPGPAVFAPPVVAASTAPSFTGAAEERIELGGAIGSSEPTEERGEQPAPPATGDHESAAPQKAVPQDATDAALRPATNDACWTGRSEEAPAAQPLSAPVVAEANAEDWTPDGALAAASVVFAGTWLRRDTAHQRDEERTHHLSAPVKAKMP